jgi:hypothetical protein
LLSQLFSVPHGPQFPEVFIYQQLQKDLAGPTRQTAKIERREEEIRMDMHNHSAFKIQSKNCGLFSFIKELS